MHLSLSIILCYNKYEIFSFHAKDLNISHKTFYKNLIILAESNKNIFFKSENLFFQLCLKTFQQEKEKKK